MKIEEIEKASKAAWAEYTKASEKIKTYDQEEFRGIMHYPEYKGIINQLRSEIVALHTKWETLNKLWSSMLPKYDPNNHISNCGCVVKDGERIHWCGDHF